MILAAATKFDIGLWFVECGLVAHGLASVNNSCYRFQPTILNQFEPKFTMQVYIEILLCYHSTEVLSTIYNQY